MAPGSAGSKNNVLPLWGNDKTMNLNNLILTNIQSSHYFKVNLFELKTYHEVIDEIYYKVAHLEPWEKGSRKTSGQTGMCGGVRGVGAGGIVSTAYCLLYKLFTLKLTRKQVNGLITHSDSPFIRALGFMYIRYTQPPGDLWDWFEEYLEDDEMIAESKEHTLCGFHLLYFSVLRGVLTDAVSAVEELDVKAGGGCVMTIGEMLRHFMSKLEWYSTLFPRIPVPIQKDIEMKLAPYGPIVRAGGPGAGPAATGRPGEEDEMETYPAGSFRGEGEHIPDDEVSYGEAERVARLRRSSSRERRTRREDEHSSRNGEVDEYGRERHQKEGSEREQSRGHSSSRHHHHHHRTSRHHRSRSRDHKRREQSKSGGGERSGSVEGKRPRSVSPPREHRHHRHRSSHSRSREH